MQADCTNHNLKYSVEIPNGNVKVATGERFL